MRRVKQDKYDTAQRDLARVSLKTTKTSMESQRKGKANLPSSQTMHAHLTNIPIALDA